MHTFIAQLMPSSSQAEGVVTYRTPRSSHKLTVTAATLSDDGKLLFTAGKDGNVSMFKLSKDSPSVQKVKTIEKHIPPNAKRRKVKGGRKKIPLNTPEFKESTKGHTQTISSLAFTFDRKLGKGILASGGMDGFIGIYHVTPPGKEVIGNIEWVSALHGHRDSITVNYILLTIVLVISQRH